MIFKIKIFLLLITFSILLPGCSLWGDFTTYFNLYYNTTDIFEKAEKQIKEQKKDLFSTEELVIPGSVNTQLIKVIEKCSEILQFHSESAYVDNALLILGKAFYYQKNYQKAQRKFDELLATQVQKEESDLVLETKLWIGKTQMKLRNYETALTTLAEVREEAVAEDNEEIFKDAFIEEIVYRISEEDYQVAIELSNQLLEKSDDDDIKAEILFEVGKLYNEIDEPENAIVAFERVLDYNPLYKIELETKIELGKALRKVKRSEAALEVFNDMKDEAKFTDSYSEIDLQIGISLKELGRTEEAVEKLVVVDTLYKNTPASGIAKYTLGEIYENDYKNFDSAGTYYQKSLTSSLPKEYQSDANQKIRTFKKYQLVRSQINNYSSQFFYIENPDIYKRDSLTFVQDSALYVQDSLEVLEELTLFSEHIQSLAGLNNTVANLDSALGKDSLAILDSLLSDSTAISTLDSTQIDSIRQVQKQMAIKEAIAKQGLNIDSLFAEKWDKDRKFPKKPAKPVLSEDSLKTLLAKNELEMGNLFLGEMNLYDSAYYYYDHVLSEYPNTSYQANALYAMGSYYLSVNQKEKADSLFNYIYDNYKTESIVNAAANQINKPLVDLEFDPAKEIYKDAEHELLTDNIDSSLDKFYKIFKEHPGSSVAPKALFTTGWILENELELYDSAAVMYDTLAVKYPQSEYTIKVRPKLTAYKQYHAQMQKAVEDSLKRLENKTFNLISSDSLRTAEDSVGLQRPPNKEVLNPDSQFDQTQKVKTPDINFPADTTRSAILNNPRRNPRKK